MKYFLICDFSTINCDRVQFSEILEENNIEFSNRNNFCWELDIPNDFQTPFCDNTSEQLINLFSKYLTQASQIMAIKCDEFYEYSHHVF